MPRGLLQTKKQKEGKAINMCKTYTKAKDEWGLPKNEEWFGPKDLAQNVDTSHAFSSFLKKDQEKKLEKRRKKKGQMQKHM